MDPPPPYEERASPGDGPASPTPLGDDPASACVPDCDRRRFVAACADGHMQAAKLLSDGWPSSSEVMNIVGEALENACAHNHAECVRWIVQAWPDVSTRDIKIAFIQSVRNATFGIILSLGEEPENVHLPLQMRHFHGLNDSPRRQRTRAALAECADEVGGYYRDYIAAHGWYRQSRIYAGDLSRALQTYSPENEAQLPAIICEARWTSGSPVIAANTLWLAFVEPPMRVGATSYRLWCIRFSLQRGGCVYCQPDAQVRRDWWDPLRWQLAGLLRRGLPLIYQELPLSIQSPVRRCYPECAPLAIRAGDINKCCTCS